MTSLRAFSRQIGVSLMAVQKAIKSGRLSACLGTDAKGRVQIANTELAVNEWRRNTDLTKAPIYVQERAAARAAQSPPIQHPAPSTQPRAAGSTPNSPTPPDAPVDPDAPVGSLSLQKAAALDKEWKAKLSELEYKKQIGELVDAGEASAAIVELITESKTKLLGVHHKVKAAIPELTPNQVFIVEGLIREALEGLAMAPAPTAAATGNAA